MTATFFADQLYGKFRHALSGIETAIETARTFDPSNSTRRFRLALSDMGELYFLARIVEALREKAPFAELDVVMLDLEQLGEWLNAGKVDAAISGRGHSPLSSAGELLFREHYVCLASLDHPRLGSDLTLEAYLAERRIGFHFTEWRQRARLMRALELLSADISVTTVAFELGYETVSAFIALFRRHFGVTPGRYFQAPDLVAV